MKSIAIIILLISAILLLDFERCHASWFSGIKRPFQSIYQKGVNIKDRMMGNNRNQTSASSSSSTSRLINGRSIAPPPSMVDSLFSMGDSIDVSHVKGNPSRDSNTSSTSDDSEYNAKCFFSRGPSFKQSPKLFFYSSAKHSNETQGCTIELQISLNSTTSQDDSDTNTSDTDPNDDTIDPDLNYNDWFIQNKLLDSGLYNGQYPTFILVHGFLASWNGDNWMCNTKDLILNKAKANVFIVDWSGGSKPMLPIDYSAAVSNTKYVAQAIAVFMNRLIPLSGQQDASKFHLIGHSLGAHISGFVGYSVDSLGRITGLDPAGPCFSTKNSKQGEQASENGQLQNGKRRLSPESANFVLALHTDTALFGLNENCGHYDVYVNGGYKQPYCGSISLTSRFNDLLDLNFNDSLNPNIVCAHSYAHSIMDSFSNYLAIFKEKFDRLRHLTDSNSTTRTAEINGLLTNEDSEPTCYPMAYQCPGWATFKAGECGYCLEGDTHCLYTGLSIVQEQPKKLAELSPDAGIAYNSSNVISSDAADDDDTFNDEEGDGDNPGDKKPENPDGPDKFIPSDTYSRGQHFIKAGSGTPTCLYHYQLIVASRRSAIGKLSNSQKYYYYLDIPLEPSGYLNDSNGQRLHDRLVQVSHKIEPDTEMHNYLRSTYLHAVRVQNPSLKFNSDDLLFYTALITFKQAPKDQCLDGDSDGDTQSSKWQLCKPLQNLQEARLWSSNGDKLDAVEWIGMNYMSGLHSIERISNSWIFERDLTEGLKSREDVDKEAQANIADLAPDQRETVGNKIKKPVGCLLSFLDQSDSGKASTNFKCNRSANELKYAIKLKALKQTPLWSTLFTERS